VALTAGSIGGAPIRRSVGAGLVHPEVPSYEFSPKC
jgi:hypothetical protein